MARTFGLAATVVFAALSLLFGSTHNSLWAAWQVQTVDSVGRTGDYPSIAIDTSGLPHISYVDLSNGLLRYGVFDGATWHLETVDSVGNEVQTSLALDSAGRPHIAYGHRYQGELRYATFDGANWQRSTIDDNVGTRYSTLLSLDLDRSDRPHIAYFNDPSHSVEYATLNDGTWQRQSIEFVGGGVIPSPSLSLDATDRPHIAYHLGRSGGLRYTTLDGTDWRQETLAAGGTIGFESLALDNLGRPNVAYTNYSSDYSTSEVRYEKYDGNSWSSVTVANAAAPNYLEWTALAVDSLGKPHIAFAQTDSPTTRELVYARLDGSSWRSEVVDTQDDTGIYPSIALDPAGRAHVAYMYQADASRHDLRYARSLAVQPPSSTTLIKALEFNVDGRLPSQEPDVEYAVNPFGIPEEAAYSVQGGYLRQRTLDSALQRSGWADYVSPDTNLRGNQFNPGQQYTMEARLRVLDIESQPCCGESGAMHGAYFGLYDGANAYQTLFDENGVFFDTTTGVQHLDFDTSGFHTYRMTTPANSNQVDLFIDGQHVLSGLAHPTDYNGYGWGDGRSVPNNGASVDWDYVRIYQGDMPPFPSPQPVQIGAARDLPRLLQHTVGGSRAEQGIAWTGDGWVTSKGDQISLETLSRFSQDWTQLIEEAGERIEVGHIGDMAWSDSYVFAPIQVNASHFPERIARYDKDTLERSTGDNEWLVPDNLQLAGLEYYNGLLFGVEYVENGFATVLVVDGDQPDSEVGRVLIDVPNANGIAINSGRVYVTSGCSIADVFSCSTKAPVAPEGRLHVFDLADFTGSLPPGTTLNSADDGFGFYSYDVPSFLHAEGLTFRDNELWVALGNTVAKLNTSKIAATKATIHQASGTWNIATLGTLPTIATSLVLSESIISVDMTAESGNLYLTMGSSLHITSQGSLVTGGTLQVRDGQFSVDGGTLDTRNLLIGGSTGANGTFAISHSVSSISVSGRISLEKNGAVSVVPGSVVHMTGSDFENRSLSPEQYTELINLTIVFEGGADVVDLLEVGGLDLGESATGMIENFALGRLVLGGPAVSRLLLVDAFTNHVTGHAPEALYVDDLVVNIGSILYLNHLSLYVNGLRVNPGDGALFGGGLILAAIPEPSTFAMIAVSSAVVMPMRRRIVLTFRRTAF